MAELIDREAFLKRFTSEYRCKFTFGEAKILNVMFEELKKEPTTTEAEIRAKAIEEFAEKLKAELSEQIFSDEEKFKYARKEQELICAQNMTWKMAIKCVDLLAEQLKEE